ncbi:hydroxyisourate hydrolase [Psychrobium sp. nBUS_13]|uniref:hydroxyisourate hydrolase n=1 Tax=Psychrobium sp. nBUS_13 TaxID=3395319 RepID=UPI003EBEA5EC
MAKLSTHVLDTANGIPAQGVKLEFFRVEGSSPRLIKTLTTNDDGRTDELLLDESSIEVGEYIIVFHVADYFSKNNTKQDKPTFLNRIPLHFGISDTNANYHVPLLVSPWSYSTYKGS